MVRIARTRVSDLFALAEREAAGGDLALADRYVLLARRVSTRYNVRLPRTYGELYCRGCSAFWVEGRTVRTRLRSGRRVRTCLKCGRARRAPLAPARLSTVPAPGRGSEGIEREEGALSFVLPEEESELADEESEEE